MKRILESWRNYLNESSDKVRNPKIQKQIDNLLALPDFIKIRIRKGITGEKGEDFIEIGYHCPKEEVAKIEQELLPHGRKKRLGDVFPVGTIEAMKAHPDYDGYCEGAFVIAGAHASKGWGPLLYEVAIEFASSLDSGLAPDRTIVSQHAAAVWDKYASRPDVEDQQLDVHYSYKGAMIDPDEYPQLTPDYQADDCIQSSAIGKKGIKWMDSPLSKVYKKKNTEVIDLLTSLNRIIVEEI